MPMTKKEKSARIAVIDTWADENGYEVIMLGSKAERVDFAPAIIGVTEQPYPAVVYSAEKIVICFMQINKWSYEEAREWFEYNTLRALPYEKYPPIIVDEDMING